MSRPKIVALIALLCGLLPTVSCTSSRVCPPNEPVYVWKEIPKPYPVVIKIEELGDVVLPEYPAHPGPEASEEALKSWALDVRRVAKQREEILLARIKADRLLIETNNRFEPLNPEP